MNPHSIGFFFNMKATGTSGFLADNSRNKGSGDTRVFAKLFDQSLSSVKGSLYSVVPKDVQQVSQTQNWIDTFRKDLMSKGSSLEKLRLSSDALPSLKKILVGQGYPEKDVLSFLNQVFKGGAKREITIPELFQKISEKKDLWDRSLKSPVLEASSVPKLETALKNLGLNSQQLETVVRQLKKSDGSLDLKQLIQNLKKIDLPAQSSQSEESVNAVKNFLACIDLPNQNANNINLQQFIQILDTKVQDLSNPVKLSQKQIEDYLSNLTSNIFTAPEIQDTFDIKRLYQSRLHVFAQNAVKDTSDIASLETSLRKMGLAPSDIQQIITQVKNTGSKVSLDSLVESLKKILPDLPEEKLEILFEKYGTENTVVFNPTQNVESYINSNKSSALTAETKDSLLPLGQWIENLEKKLKTETPVLSEDSIKSQGAEIFIPASDVSLLEKLLKGFGLESSKIKQIIAQSSTNENTLSLNKLVQDLKDTVSDIPGLQQSESHKASSALVSGIQPLINDMEKLLSGFEKNDEKSNTIITLKNFIKQFESRSEKLAVLPDSQISAGKFVVPLAEIQVLAAAFQDLGMESSQVKKIIGEARQAKGISLSSLVNTLKTSLSDIDKTQLEKKSAFNSKAVGNAVKNVESILSNNGVIDKVDNNSVTFKELVEKLERKLENFSQNASKQRSVTLSGQEISSMEKTSQSDMQKIETSIIPKTEIPALKEALKELGLSSLEIKTAIANTGDNVSLRDLILNLKEIIQKVPVEDQPISSKSSYKKIENLFASLHGMEEKSESISLSSKDAVSLEDFIKNLETKFNNHNELPLKSAKTIIPQSEIPELKSILQKFGLSSQQIQNITSNFNTGANGLPVINLVRNLKEILQKTSGRNSVTSDELTLDSLLTHKAIKIDDTVESNGQQPKTSEINFFDSKSRSFLENQFKHSENNVPVENSKEHTVTKDSVDNQNFSTFIKQDAVSDRSPLSESILKTPSRPVPNYMSQQVGRQVSLALKRGDNQVRLQLKPAQLGSLQLDMEVHNNVLKIGIAADKQTTKDLLLANVHELKSALSEHGIKVDKVDIQINYNFSNSNPNERRQFNQKQYSGKRFNLSSFVSGSEFENEDNNVFIEERQKDSSLNLIA
ncbi:flagellar hook-length control protein FliK [Candidatus Magnetomoraceae bacterium gMMP-1]